MYSIARFVASPLSPKTICRLQAYAYAATRPLCRCVSAYSSPFENLPSQCGQALVMIFRPTIFDRYILAFDVTDLAQPLTECRQEIRKGRGRCAVKKPDYRHRRLLRTQSKRPRYRRAT